MRLKLFHSDLDILYMHTSFRYEYEYFEYFVYCKCTPLFGYDCECFWILCILGCVNIIAFIHWICSIYKKSRESFWKCSKHLDFCSSLGYSCIWFIWISMAVNWLYIIFFGSKIVYFLDFSSFGYFCKRKIRYLSSFGCKYA